MNEDLGENTQNRV